jgi:hypothetical protein
MCSEALPSPSHRAEGAKVKNRADLNIFKADYRGYRYGETHVRVCFFLGRLGTSLVSADEAQCNLLPLEKRVDLGGGIVDIEVGSMGEVLS